MNFQQFEDEDNYYDDDFESGFAPQGKGKKQPSFKSKKTLEGKEQLDKSMKKDTAAGDLKKEDTLKTKSTLPFIETKKTLPNMDLSIKQSYGQNELPVNINNQPKQASKIESGYSNQIQSNNSKSLRMSVNESEYKPSFISNNQGNNSALFTKPSLKSKMTIKNPLTTEYEPTLQQTPQKSKVLTTTNQYSKPLIMGGSIIQETPKQNNLLKPELKSKPFDIQPNLLSKGGKNTSSTPNLQTSNKRFEQSMNDAKQYLGTIQGITPNFVKQNIDHFMKGDNEFTQIFDFIERTRKRLINYENEKGKDAANTNGIDIEDMVKYSMLYDENVYLTSVIKNIKEHIDILFTKYDPRTMPIRQHPISESLKFQPTDEQVKTRDREIENADKQLTTLLVDYQKVLERVEQVRNPTYLGDLHDQLQVLEEAQKKQEKDNKYKLIAQQKRESTIEKILQDGAPKSIFRIKELQDKLASIKEGIKRETISKQKYDELMTNLETQEYQLKDRESKCLQIAKSNKIEFKDIEEPTSISKTQLEEAKKLLQQKDQMGKKILHQKMEANLQQKKGEMQERYNKKRIQELKVRMQELRSQFQEASGSVQVKNVEINDLMEKLNSSKKNPYGSYDDTDIQGYNNNKTTKQGKNPKERGINYDAVQKAIEEMNLKESEAALVIQKSYRMLLARREYRVRLQVKKEQEELQKLKQQEAKRLKDEQRRQQNQKQQQQQSAKQVNQSIGGNESKLQNSHNNPVVNQKHNLAGNGEIGIDNKTLMQQQNQSSIKQVNEAGTQQEQTMKKIASKPNLMSKKK